MRKTTPKPGYKFDHINSRIVLTRDFNKKAGILGSNEHKTLQKLQKLHPDYTLEFAAPHRKTSVKSHITLEKIIRYIEQQPDKESLMADLRKVRFPENSVDAAPFSKVKQWFFRRFPNYGRMTPFDENGQLIRHNEAAATI